MHTLDKINIGHSVTIIEVLMDELAPKLSDMGLYPGKEIYTLFKAPFGGPLAIKVGGDYILSLRKMEATRIRVSINRP